MLDAFKKVEDSLVGRFFQYRVHPFDLREISHYNPKEDRKEILEKTHLDIILRQDCQYILANFIKKKKIFWGLLIYMKS